MRFSGIAAASLVVPLVAAHGGIPGAPKIFGLGPNPMAKLKGRNAFHGHTERHATPHHESQLAKRQGGADGRCGPAGSGASCDAGFCCSPGGWCGVGTEYCAAPDCLFQYGPACDANSIPSGTNTSSVARPQLGAVEYGGEGIYSCTVPGTVALTYDDGPYIYTAGVLDQFKSYNAKATFFITGKNNGKGAIDDAGTAWPAVIKRMVAEGHQVASHTWSHQDLSAITSAQRKDQMVKNEMAIRNIIGKFPTYMRPPYSSCSADSGCQDDLKALGYVVSYFDLDTDDYNNETPALIQNAKDNFSNKITPSNPTTDDFLVIGHDIHQQTAQNLTGYMLDLLTTKGYKIVTMGECMGEVEANWYRSSSGSIVTSSSATPSATATTTFSTGLPVASPTAVSPDGTCGGTTGYSCIGFSQGSCCSQYGYCGSTTDYCAVGCQSAFGSCNGDGLQTSTISTRAATSSPVASSSRATSASSVRSSTIASSTPVVVSPDGTCGGTTRYSCIGFSQGSCCSQYGWCGSSTDHCAAGCQSAFGSCNGASLQSSAAVSTPSVRSSTIITTARPASTSATRASSAAVPVATQVISKDGTCGGAKQQTCAGSGKNECCRWDGKCSNNILGCGTGCQKKFGKCWW